MRAALVAITMLLAVPVIMGTAIALLSKQDR